MFAATLEAAKAGDIYLNDLSPDQVHCFDSLHHLAIAVGGVASPNGFIAHPHADLSPGSVTYSLLGKVETLTGSGGVNDTGTPRTPLTFVINRNGRELWKSKSLDTPGQSQPFEVSVKGIDRLELLAYAAHAVWIEPKLIRKVRLK